MYITLNLSANFFFHTYRMGKNSKKTRRTSKNRRTARKTRKARRGGQRANASTCPPGQVGTNFKSHNGYCAPYNSTYKLMSGTTN